MGFRQDSARHHLIEATRQAKTPGYSPGAFLRCAALPDFVVQPGTHDLEAVPEFSSEIRIRWKNQEGLVANIHVQRLHTRRPVRVERDFGTAADRPAAWSVGRQLGIRSACNGRKP